jgi:ribonucleoside-diphosphate reductase alpha chain
MQMKVQKRNGDIVPMLFDKVVTRISKLCTGLDVQPDRVAQKVFSNMYDGIKTSDIDDLSSEVAVHMQTEHPDYEVLATRIVASNMRKMAPKCYSDCALYLYLSLIHI